MTIPGVAAGALIVALFVAGPEQYTWPRQMLSGLHEPLSSAICAAAVLVTAVSLLLFGGSQLFGLAREG